MWAWAVAALASIALGKLWAFVAKFVFYCCALLLEKYVLATYYRLEFPRSHSQVYADPGYFFSFLRRNGLVPKGTKLSSVGRLAEIQTEPDKNATSASIIVKYTTETSSEVHCKSMFLKFQTGKGMPLWLQALRCVAEPGVAREIDFYSNLSKRVPINTPKALYCGKYPALNVVCLILEYLDVSGKGDLQVIPDHEFASVPGIEKMMTEVAKMHGMYLNTVLTDVQCSWIPKKTGLGFCDWILSLGGTKDKPEQYVLLFKALQTYFDGKPLTLVHGDCRPGNMIFSGNPIDRVIFADWEATNIAPPAWDFTYATVIGLDANVRRDNQKHLLEEYHRALVTSASCKVESFETFEDDVNLLTIVLFYLSYTIATGGFWDNQGNTRSDLDCWGRRVLTAMKDVDIKRASVLLGLDHAVLKFVQEDFADAWSASKNSKPS
mmetsp:Transcript_3102/g.4441  ORF Transcript_3102/g.4441 Transcript_3102/m.4441 type:complete len:436 (-) Transcript_3102:1083-2390(-)|eukprot:CAMPEP_0203747198 /NCGR_PEP_ID=MMETSP0098-20131031/2423_1 /ASSEMBLY_ACC=CAM_ASM_000208 /TAXON_ID=96639 /ORGANISM=" , Strain NY0313808BC1" /LENGTH=435 /DNA_ID=CAMNT_0050635563 /DNA_START=2278 /DNA_END=3585 /DNA_ORIENTATION=+